MPFRTMKAARRPLRTDFLVVVSAWHCKGGIGDCGDPHAVAAAPRAVAAAEGPQLRRRRSLPCSTLDPGSITPTSSAGSGADTGRATVMNAARWQLADFHRVPSFPFLLFKGSLSLALFLQDPINHIINSVSAALPPFVAL